MSTTHFTPRPFPIYHDPYRVPSLEQKDLPPWLKEIGQLRAGKFLNEDRLQHYIYDHLRWHDDGTTDLIYARELTLPEDAGRIDFAVYQHRVRWGIECKTNPGGLDVWRQLQKYERYFDALVLVTTKPIGEYMKLPRQCLPVEYLSAVDHRTPTEPTMKLVPVLILDLWKNL